MIQVCVLFGGFSSEYEVSLRSAASVLRNIPKEKYSVHMLGITKEGQWLYYTGDVEAIENDTWASSGRAQRAVLSPDRTHRGILLQDRMGIVIPVDVVFPVLHGKNGEDGTMQGLLELSGIPYVGCGVLASAVCMDKAVSHDLLVAAGIPKTKLVCLARKDMADPALVSRLEQELGYPMFVKPANAGSSVGVTKVKAAHELGAALELAFVHDTKAVVEKAMNGQEIECSVMGNDEPVASAVLGEIVPAADSFYDYSAKYLDDTAGLCIPANLTDTSVVEQVRDIAVKAYKALGCRGLSRVDFFVEPGGKVILNEINTIPGFTSISMFPKLFEAGGIPYPQLIDKLIDCAMEARQG